VSHLTDIACLEWVRHRAVTLAPETTEGVEAHLAECGQCRSRVADFETLERSFHPWGAPTPAPRALRLGRWLKIAALVAAAATVLGVAVRLGAG
jgi:hypothetical protein